MTMIETLKGWILTDDDRRVLGEFGSLIREKVGKPVYYVLPLAVTATCGFARGIAGDRSAPNAEDVREWGQAFAVSSGLVSSLKVSGTMLRSCYDESREKGVGVVQSLEHSAGVSWVPGSALAATHFAVYFASKELGWRASDAIGSYIWHGIMKQVSF